MLLWHGSLTLQSRRRDTRGCSNPGDRRIQGFRCTHQLSPWLSDYGHAIFLPFSGEPKLEPDARSSSYRPEEAELHPYALRVNLLRFRANVELVATERCCVLTARFTDSGPRGLLFEVPRQKWDDGAGRFAQGRKKLVSTANDGGVPDNFATYYVVAAFRAIPELRRARGGRKSYWRAPV